MAYQAPTLPQIDTRGAVTALLQAGTNRGSLPGTLLGQYQDRVLAEEKAKLVQANADRTFGLQEANAKRLQAEYDRVNTLRNASAVVGKMNPLENTNTALISDLAARQAELDSKNLPSLGIETNGESTPVFSQKDLRSPKAFESRMKDTLLAQGLTHAEIAPIVEQRMQEIYPTTSAEARAAANTAQDKKLEIMSKLYTGKSGTTNVNINGSGVGGGATNTDSYNNSYSNIQKIMEAGNLPDSPNWWSGLVNTIRGQDTATKHNVSQAASNLMKFDPSIDANAAIFAVMSGIQNNYISKDSIAEPSMEQTKKLVADAKAIGNTSGRSRTKVGGDGSANLQSNEDSLRQLFLEDAKAREAILNSGLRGDTIYSDRVNDINPNTGNDNRSFARQLEEANKANKSKGGTGKDTKKSIFKTDDTTTDSKDDKEVKVVTDAVKGDSTGHEYGVDFQSDVKQLTNTTGKGAGVIAGIISNMFDYANEVSTSVDNYFDSEDKTRKPSKPGETVDKMIGNAATSFLNMFDGPAPVDRSPLANMENSTPTKEDTLKNELIKYTDSLHTKTGQTKAIEDALQMVSGSSGASAKMMRPGVEGKFVATHMADLAKKAADSVKNSTNNFSVRQMATDSMSKAARKLTDKIFSKRETSGKGVFYKGMGSTSHFPQNVANEVGHILSKTGTRSTKDASRLREILNEYPTLHAKIKPYL